MNRVYRFFNCNVDKWGEPFALCDKHAKKQIVPQSCVFYKIADKAVDDCIVCQQDQQPPTRGAMVKKRKSANISLYRFFNYVQDSRSIQFGLCDKHRLEQRIPEFCILEKIADKSHLKCAGCQDKQQPSTREAGG